MVTRTRSPGWRYFGGVNPMPTPAGVPVAMMSPGMRRVVAEKHTAEVMDSAKTWERGDAW